MNYVIDCEEYELEKKQLVLIAFNRLGLRPIIYGKSYNDDMSTDLESACGITNSNRDSSSPEYDSFDQLMKDSDLPFREDGKESCDLSGIEDLVVNYLLPKSEKDCIVASYTLTLTDEDLENIFKEL